MLGRLGEMEMLVTWKQGMKSLLMGMCTTSTECKVVMKVVLMVKSGMDPHMISRDTGWFRNGMGLVRIGHSVTLWCDGGQVF
jgi:hypothetical protein